MPMILVVDDNSVDRALASDLLRKQPGWRVVEATSGRDALDVLARQSPDLVLTDLIMPDMNGLALVEQVRALQPLLPVILMTAYGNEEVAVQALRLGAASYVPKANLARDLVESVESVLNLAQADRQQQRLQECLTRTESYYELENDPELVPPLVGQLQQVLARLKICDELDRIRAGVALQEALINAIQHGNLEAPSALREEDERAFQNLIRQRRQQAPYGQRRVHVLVRATPTEALFLIRDEGPGFDPSTLADPTDPKNLEKATGRGLLLIRTFMDEVRHNALGNQITMVKRRRG
jgi:CheY-like chemotaxis protein